MLTGELMTKGRRSLTALRRPFPDSLCRDFRRSLEGGALRIADETNPGQRYVGHGVAYRDRIANFEPAAGITTGGAVEHAQDRTAALGARECKLGIDLH